MNVTELRPLVIEDAESVRKLAERCSPLILNSPYVYIFLAKYFGETCLVAESNRALVGFVLALKSTENPETLFLWQIGVDPVLRRQGVATRLLEELTQVARAKKCKEIQFSISPNLDSSLATFSYFAEKHALKMSSMDSVKYTPSVPEAPRGHEIFYRIELCK